MSASSGLIVLFEQKHLVYGYCRLYAEMSSQLALITNLYRNALVSAVVVYFYMLWKPELLYCLHHSALFHLPVLTGNEFSSSVSLAFAFDCSDFCC